MTYEHKHDICPLEFSIINLYAQTTANNTTEVVATVTGSMSLRMPGSRSTISEDTSCVGMKRQQSLNDSLLEARARCIFGI